MQRRKDEDEKRARLASEQESRRRRAEEDRMKRMAEGSRKKAEERAVVEAEEARLREQVEAQKRAEEESAARLKARERAELSVGLLGLQMFKISRNGSAKLTLVKLVRGPLAAQTKPPFPPAKWFVQWQSKTKTPDECCLLLNECELILGIGHGQFRKKKWRAEFGEARTRCFSILAPEDAGRESLDLVVQTQEAYDLFIGMLRRLPLLGVLDGRGTKEEEGAALE
jgi:hypothetical protein